MYLMYLRKSRADDPNETVEEVLSKHETRLQNFMQRRFGYKIAEENIYREVCSAESIADRVEIKKVLARIENADVAGVLVADVPRLSRGDLGDCNEIITRFRYTKTLVLTDTMQFNLEDKRDRQYFQDELLRGAYYLDYVKEVLRKGREGAVQNRGCFIGTRPPYGYNKTKIGKNHTLEPNKDADIVRLIFEWYVDGDTFYQIACKLNDMGIPAPKGGMWKKDTVRVILKNPHYDGKVTYGAIKATTLIENGEVVRKKLAQTEYILAEGIHPAIVDHEVFIKAQEIRANNPSAKVGYDLKNPFSGILKCAKCGKTMAQHPYKHAETRLECRDKTTRCGKSVKMSDVEKAVIMALELSELPNLEAKLKNDDGNAYKIKKSLLANLEKELEDLKAQEEKHYEFLETGRYTEEVFDKRNAILRDKMKECEKKIKETQLSMPKQIDYAERITTMKKAIEALKSDVPPAEKNKFLKAIVERIDIETWGTNKRNDVQFHLDIFLRL